MKKRFKGAFCESIKLQKPSDKEFDSMLLLQRKEETLLLGKMYSNPILMPRSRDKYCPHILMFGAGGHYKSDDGCMPISYEGRFITDFVLPNIQNSKTSSIVYVGCDTASFNENTSHQERLMKYDYNFISPELVKNCDCRAINRYDPNVKSIAEQLVREKSFLFINHSQINLLIAVYYAVLDIEDSDRTTSYRHIDFMIDIDNRIPFLSVMFANSGNYNISFIVHFTSITSMKQRYSKENEYDVPVMLDKDGNEIQSNRAIAYEEDEWLNLRDCANGLVQLSPFKSVTDMEEFIHWTNEMNINSNAKPIREKDKDFLSRMALWRNLVVVKNYTPFYCYRDHFQKEIM